MNNSEINSRIKVLRKELAVKKNERKLLATEYGELIDKVKKSGIICIIALVLNSFIFQLMNTNKHVTLKGIAQLLRPITIIVFLVSLIYVLIKGFDLFINADNKYSKKVAGKFNIEPITVDINAINETIMMLEEEVNRLSDIILDDPTLSFEDYGESEETGSQNQVYINLKKNTTEADDISQLIFDNKKHIEKSKKSVNVKNNIYGIFSGLDDLDEDDDNVSSSELWKKDARKPLDRY